MRIEGRSEPLAAAPIRVVAADPNPLFRQALARLIREAARLDVVADVPHGHDALRAIRDLGPDVALLDIALPELDGRAVLNAVQRDGLPTRVIFLSAQLDPHLAYEMVEEGAMGFMSKDAEPDEICDAVVAVVEGRTAFGREIQVGLASEIRLRRRPGRPVLSEREHQILDLVGEGLRAPEIAERLYLSPATVRTHLGHLYGKLGVSDRAAAIRRAMRRGLLE